MELPDAALLRVLNGRSQPVGVAFLVDTAAGVRILTCEHVLGDDPVFTTFDGVHRVPAELVDSEDDLASLRPLGPLPAGTTTLRLTPTDPWNGEVRCFGFPAGYDDGVWATGRLSGRQGGGLVLVEDDRTTGFAVQQGFSGGPAWDPETRSAVGMVVSVSKRASRRTAFLVPAATLLDRWPAAGPPPSPYRGLKSFREQDAELFHGRDELAEAVAAKVLAERVVALVGPSGRGKSSLIFAGVVPRLRARGELTIVSVRPRGDALGARAGALVDVLEPDLTETARLAQRPALAEVIAAGRLAEVVDRVLAKTGDAELLVIVDQVEEALAQNDHDTADVLGALADAPVRLLVAIRSDFLDRALDRPELARVLRSCDTVGAMTADQLRAAVTGPLPPDVRLEGDLATRIVDDVRLAPGRLPLLQVALDKLWDKQVGGLLTHAAYDELGGVAGAVARYAEQEVWSRLSEAERAVAPGLFLRLVRTAPDQGLWFAGDVLVSLTDGRVRRWDVVSGDFTPVRDGITAVAVDAAGTVLITCTSESPEARTVYEVRPVTSLDAAPEYTFPTSSYECGDGVHVDPTGRYLVLPADGTSSGLLVDLREHRSVAQYEQEGVAQAVFTAPEGVRVVATVDSSVTVARVVPGTLPNSVTSPHAGVLGQQLSAALHWDVDGTLIALWNDDGQRLRGGGKVAGEATRAWLTPDDRHLVIAHAERPGLEIRRLPDLDLVAEVPATGPVVVRFDPLGRLLTGGDGRVATWDVATGRQVGQIAVPTPDRAGGSVPFDVLGEGRIVVVSPDGHGLDELDLASGRRGAHHDVAGSPVVGVHATPRPGIFVLVRNAGDGGYQLTIGDKRIDSVSTSRDHTVADIDSELRPQLDLGAERIRRADFSLKTWDYDGTDHPTLDIGGARAFALDGDRVLTENGVVWLDPEQWARHLCGLVGHRDLAEDIAGVTTTGLCHR
ncbi:S1 family peptidase [Saccharothrix deserti]|uniref:S1 family peptidase n=1 Tax=Saccharothrix deserti TaxID=2593674 RepID=UPI00131CA486|nr:serine protease [Saccharothrix deserti]